MNGLCHFMAGWKINPIVGSIGTVYSSLKQDGVQGGFEGVIGDGIGCIRNLVRDEYGV